MGYYVTEQTHSTIDAWYTVIKGADFGDRQPKFKFQFGLLAIFIVTNQ